MRTMIFLVLMVFGLLVFSVSAKNPYDQPGPTIAKVAAAHRFDNMPKWKADMVKRLEALDDAQAAEGGDSVFLCEFPECACRIVTHGLVCVSTYFMDCLLHIFQPCKHIEIIQ